MIATSEIGSGGSFELIGQGLGAGSYQAAVFGGAHAAWRRLVDLAADTDEDLGTVELRRAEYPAGIRGKLWDGLGDHPVTPGRVLARHGERLIGEAAAEHDGIFALDMTCERPLPPGEYRLEVEAAGYARRTLTLKVVEDLTVYELGRIGLAPEIGDADR